MTRVIVTMAAAVAAIFVVLFMSPAAAHAQSATALSTGSDSACAVTNKIVKCWGSNNAGKLGANSSAGQATKPVAVYSKAAEKGVTERSCAVWLIVCVTYYKAVPYDNPASPLYGRSVNKVSVGKNHACAVADARVSCWGSNSSGQLGNYTRNDSSVPVAVATRGGHTEPAYGYCEGRENEATGCAFPTGRWVNVAKQDRPASALQNKEIIDVTAGNEFTCALASDGTVACWGRNDHGQLGIGNKDSKSVPVAVTSGALSGKKVTKLATVRGDAASMCAITSEERAVCWGRDDFGEVGNGGNMPSKSLVASGSGHHTNKNRCDVTNKEALKQIRKSGSINLTKGDVLRPANVSTSQRFASIEITARGDSVVTVDDNFNPGNKTGKTTLKGDGYTYVTAKTSGTSENPDRAFYWGGGYLYDFLFDCVVNNDYNDNASGAGGGDGGTNESTDTTAKITAYQFGRTMPTGPLYTNPTANQLRNQSLAVMSGNGFAGGNYGQYKQCLSRDEYSWFGLVKTTVTTCAPEPSEDGCAVTKTKQDAVYCDTGRTCTGGGFLQPLTCNTSTTKQVPSGEGSWLKPGMNLYDVETGASDFNCALSGATIGCWGSNGKGQLGDGTTTNRTNPVRVQL